MKAEPYRTLKGKHGYFCTMIVLHTNEDGMTFAATCHRRAKALIGSEAVCARCITAHELDCANVHEAEIRYGGTGPA